MGTVWRAVCAVGRWLRSVPAAWSDDPGGTGNRAIDVARGDVRRAGQSMPSGPAPGRRSGPLD